MNKKRLVVTSLLLALLLVVSNALAKGPPDKVLVMGIVPGAELEITDPALLNSLGVGQFEIFDAIEEPSGLRGGLHLTRYFYDDLQDAFFPFDALVYFPDPSGGAGYLYYVGIVGGWSEYDGKWSRVREDGDAAMQIIFEDYHTFRQRSLALLRDGLFLLTD